MAIPEKLGSVFYRSFLTPQGQAFYDRLHAQLLQGDFSGEISFAISDLDTSAEDCFAAYKALRDDKPDLFFLGYPLEFCRNGDSGTLKFPILYTPETIERIWTQVRRYLCKITRETADKSMVDREALIYGRIAKSMTYKDQHDYRDHSLVGPVLFKEGVCEGQNALLLLCLRRVGIPCIKVYGKTKADEWHCWTVAWIDAKPVHCDVTWERQPAAEGFKYFNLTDDEISTNHFEFKSARIPVCSVSVCSDSDI